MAYTIDDTCIGCTACTKRCPTNAITGTRNVIHVIAQNFTDMTPLLVGLAQGRDLGQASVSRADEGREGLPIREGRDEPMRRNEERLARQARAALPAGRNFH